MLRLAIAIALLSGCRSHPPPAPAPMKTTSSSPIDDTFRTYEKKLPAPATLSEENGATFECPHHGWVTYTHLYALSQKLTVAGDEELVRLVPWARNEDTCLRQIAIQAIVQRIKLDPNNLSVPGMHEPEHYHFHNILGSLRRYLIANKVSFDPKVFDGLMLDVTAKDFARLKGKWAEEATPAMNFVTSVEVDGELLRVTTHRTTPDPAWPDHTWTTKIKGVTVNERGQFVLDGEWNVESNAKGYQGNKIIPSQFAYSFWPVRADIVWFDQGGGNWTKLRRTPN